MFETQNYIKSLVIPQAKAAKTARRVWSIDLETVWLPFFHASNVMGDTAIPSEALGAPLRLAVGKDGAIRFNQNGKPVIRVAKDLSDMVRLIRDNFTAGLMSYANGVATENPDGYATSIESATEAGKPIITHDNAMIADYYRKQAVAEAEAIANATEAKGESEEKPKRKAKTEPVKEPELVTA